MSGEPPSDVTTKDPFQDMTEQPFTFDYEDTTHSQAMDEEEGKTNIWSSIQGPTNLCQPYVFKVLKLHLFLCGQGCWGQGPSQPLL